MMNRKKYVMDFRVDDFAPNKVMKEKSEKHLCKVTRYSIESQNHLGWQRTSIPSSPAIPPSLPRPALTNIPQCHIHMAVKSPGMQICKIKGLGARGGQSRCTTLVRLLYARRRSEERGAPSSEENLWAEGEKQKYSASRRRKGISLLTQITQSPREIRALPVQISILKRGKYLCQMEIWRWNFKWNLEKVCQKHTFSIFLTPARQKEQSACAAFQVAEESPFHYPLKFCTCYVLYLQNCNSNLFCPLA